MAAEERDGRRVVALCGGTGGAKLVDGLRRCVPPDSLRVVVNTGDDFEHLGLSVCPDLDTVLYTAAGIAHRRNGWGLAGDTRHAMRALARLGGETWFHLGDRDLATHLARTGWLAEGRSLTEIARDLARALGAGIDVLPMSDDRVRTIITTGQGERSFQEWFVRDRCHPPARAVRYRGASSARPGPGVLPSIADARVVVVCPSNPYLSIGPILSLPGMRTALAATDAVVVAVSPVLGGRAVKGPTAEMLRDLAGEASPMAVARLYAGFVDGWLIDRSDTAVAPEIRALGAAARAGDILMRQPGDRLRVAREALTLADEIADGPSRPR